MNSDAKPVQGTSKATEAGAGTQGDAAERLKAKRRQALYEHAFEIATMAGSGFRRDKLGEVLTEDDEPETKDRDAVSPRH